MIDIIVIQPDGTDVPNGVEDILKYCGEVQGLSGATISGELWSYDLFPEKGSGPKSTFFRIADVEHDPKFITVVTLGYDLGSPDPYWPDDLRDTLADVFKLIVEPECVTASHLSSSGNSVTTITSTYPHLREVVCKLNRNAIHFVR